MEQNKDSAGQREQSGECSAAWTRVDELNWAADRDVLRRLKKRGEEPSAWLATEYRELSAKRKAARA